MSIHQRDNGPAFHLLDGFEGKLTSSKWARLTKCSQDTAGRDIKDLVEKRILSKDPAGGRSTSYSLMIPEQNLARTTYKFPQPSTHNIFMTT